MNRAKVVAVIQARVNSSRLPGKVLEEIAGRPMLAHVIQRARRAERVDEVVVATTTDVEDEPIEALCRELACPIFRGHATDVLDRTYQAARAHAAAVVARITADCPLLDPALVDRCVEALLESNPPLDFVATRLPGERTYPIGLDVEVCRFEDLETVWREATEPYQREHVMPFFYEHAERFAIRVLHAPADYGDLRWTVDTPEDLEFVRVVFDRLLLEDTFRWEAVLGLVQAYPELAAINAGVSHKTQRDVDARFGRG